MPVIIKKPGDSLRPVSRDASLSTLPPPPKNKHEFLVYAFIGLQVAGLLTGAIIYLILVHPLLEDYKTYTGTLALCLLLSSLSSLCTHVLVLRKIKRP